MVKSHSINLEITYNGNTLSKSSSLDHISVSSNGSIEWSYYDENKCKTIGSGTSVATFGKKIKVRIEIE